MQCKLSEYLPASLNNASIASLLVGAKFLCPAPAIFQRCTAKRRRITEKSERRQFHGKLEK